MLKLFSTFLAGAILHSAQAHEVTCSCPLIYAPVCGANNETYSNECLAKCEGVWSCPGTCPQACAESPPDGWDYFTCDSLPHYWFHLAEDFGVDHCRIGFNITENQWYIDDIPTCVGWGEFDEPCDYDEYYCAGTANQFYGYGVHQMEHIATMVNNSQSLHQLCPHCPPPADPNTVAVCHDKTKYIFNMSSGGHHDFGLPGSMALEGRGTWLTCDCDEVHKGYPLEDGGYWATLASAAGLDPAKVTHFGGVWYYDGMYSCVGKGMWNGACSDMMLLCAGSGGTTYGYGIQQMNELKAASDLPSGEHAYCPMP